MPKDALPTKERLESYVNFFGPDVLSTDGTVLWCKPCDKEISRDKEFAVAQHAAGASHIKLLKQVMEPSSPRAVEFGDSLVTAGGKAQYSMDLCDAFFSANILLRKLDHAKLKAFLEKYISQATPSSVTVRLNYISDLYERKLKHIRNSVTGKKIWISLDETTDVTGQFVANAVIGTLDTSDPKVHLLHTEHLEKTNHSTVAQMFLNSLAVLWPTGMKHDDVLLFVTDCAPYMKKAGATLKVIFPKMLHVTCAAHALHRIAEVIRHSFKDVDSLVSNGKKIFRKSPSRLTMFRKLASGAPLPPQPVLTRWGTWLDAAIYYAENLHAFSQVVNRLHADEAECIGVTQKLLKKRTLEGSLAVIAANFRCISPTIEKLEGKNAPLTENTRTFEELIDYPRRIPGAIGGKVSRKCDWVLSQNPDYKELSAIAKVLRGDVSALNETGLSPSEVAAFKFAPITSVDVERSFSFLKHVLNDRRQSFTFVNLKMVLVTACNP